MATEAEPIREIDIRNLHRLVLLRSLPEEAGQYSKHQRLISGSSLVLPSPVELPALMGDLGLWLQNAATNPDTAFAAHLRLVTIHPFSDGNGRTARLLMNLLLLKFGYPPVVILPEDRNSYHQALDTAQTGGAHAPYDRFMNERLVSSLDHYLQTLRLSIAPDANLERFE